MKSLLTYWGMSACLIGLHSLRTIPLSGTPFNNSTQDMATLMTMIDPTLDSASEDWWKNATSGSAARSVTDAISEWSTNFLIRRDKSVIEKNLPTKTIYKKAVAPYPLELSVYVCVSTPRRRRFCCATYPALRLTALFSCHKIQQL